MLIGALAGGLSALLWGVGDFLAVKPVREIGPFRTLLYSVPFGLLVLFLYVFFFEGFAPLPMDAVLLVCLSAVFNLAALFSFYSSFERGLLSVAAPISSSYSAIVVLLSFLFLGEVLSFSHSLAVLLAIMGVVLVSAKFSEIKRLKFSSANQGVKFAFLSAIFWGIGMFLLKPVSALAPNQGGLVVLVLELAFLLFLLAFGFFWKKDFSRPPAGLLPFVAASYFLNASASVLFVWGVYNDLASLVAPISALYPAVSVVLAFVFLKERLEKTQYLGIVFAACALLLAAG